MMPLADLAGALDRMIRAELENSSNVWFWILVGSTIAVGIGILFEAPEVWSEVGIGQKTVARIREFWYLRLKTIDLGGWERICPELVTKPNKRHRKWIAKAGFIGWLLVAFGVGGEGISEYFVNHFETDIRQLDEASLSQTTREAGDAGTSARRGTR